MGKRKKGGGGLVYSTGVGRMCPGCGRPASHCLCNARKAERAGGAVRVGRETKGRKGKGVTVVTGLPLGDMQLAVLAKEIKAACGAGGTVRDGVVEIQGEHRDTVVEFLKSKGYDAKRSGG